MVLEGIDWQIRSGEQWALIGPNGSGKTTLAKALAGILPSSGGKILFHSSKDGNGDTLSREGIGFVSADLHRHVFEREVFAEEVRHFTGDRGRELTALDFILGRSITDEKPKTFPSDLTNLLRLLNTPGNLLEKTLGSLATGEISQILILKALIKKPHLLVMDEPFSGLDRESREAMTRLISHLVHTDTQVVLITHRIREIPPEITHVMAISAGGIKKSGSKNELLEPEFMRRDHLTPYALPDMGTQGRDRRKKQPPILPVEEKGTPCPGCGETLVEMIDVCVRYDRFTILDNVNWTIRQDENWLVHGPGGAGKSTLLKLITGDNPQAYANDIHLFGKKRGTGESVWEIKRKIGWISSDLQSRYPAQIQGAEVVQSGFFDSIGLYRTASASQQRRAWELLESLGIGHLANKRFGNLSHGQKQMLLIARAVVKSPLLLLLDDPCEGLDSANREKIMELTEFIGHHTSTVLVLATWDETEAPACITHRLVLNRGKAETYSSQRGDPTQRWFSCIT